MKKFVSALALGLGLTVGAATPAIAPAATVNFTSDSANSSNGLGDFEGSITYDNLTQLLTVVLKNTTDTPGVTTAYITAFVFNIDGQADADLIDVDDLSTADFNESNFDDTDSESAAPYGTFDEGAGLNGAFLGGGAPQNGIAIGHMGIFKFNIVGQHAPLLDVNDFLTTDEGSTDAAFMVRFRGIDEGEGSDKVPAFYSECPPPPTIPLPAGVWSAMSLLGLLGVKKYGKQIRGLLG